MEEKDKPTLVVIAGPTAVGKSRLAIELAKRIDGEIISCDSAQVYRGLNIGSAKVRPDEMDGVRHHLLDVVDPASRFTVAEYQKLARAAILDVHSRGSVPILVGGTGLWIRAVVRGYEFPEEIDQIQMRTHIAEIAQRYGWEALRRVLRMVDPESYRKIALSDRRRISRALEVWWASGRRLARSPGDSPYRVSYWVVFRPVAQVHARIAERTRSMLDQGLRQEVAHLLLDHSVPKTAQSMTAIGYRETVAWYYGRLSDDALERWIVRHGEQLAKRQMTWFRSETDAHWLDLATYGESKAVVAIERSVRQWSASR
ncbi:MAG: tRNA (adenosine(37)-N6)-dimethylallyltransferase MiaA [Firmicutes bacterium]|nr:tRNA (adenosine(37)-N6)-dimethylallyltransferase MiaA [Bacillota bacterium]